MKLLTIILYFLLVVEKWKGGSIGIGEVSSQILDSSGNFNQSFEKIVNQPPDYKLDKPEFDNEVNTILQTLDKETSFLSNENLILVFGSIQSKKSLLVQFLTGNNDNLVSSRKDSLETLENLIVQLINEKNNNSVSNQKNDRSWEILNSDLTPIQEPSLSNLLSIDLVSGEAYYEFPAFNKDETFFDDITWKYYNWRIINQAKSLKIIMTVGYSSVNNSINIPEFLELVNHTVNLIPSVEKFNESIGLVVTNVNNSDNSHETISTIRSGILKGLLNASEILSRNGQVKGSQSVKDLFAPGKDGKQSKIGIFSRPTAEGVVSKMNSFQDEKKALKSLIRNALKFTNSDSKDFVFSLSPQRKNKKDNEKLVQFLGSTIQKRIDFTKNKINQEILNHFQKWELRVDDMHDLKDDFSKSFVDVEKLRKNLDQSENDEEKSQEADKKYLDIKSDRKALEQLAQDINRLKIEITNENFMNIFHSYNCLEYIETYSDHRILSTSKNWKMNKIKKFLRCSANWYTFLIEIFNFFSDFEVQSRPEHFEMLTQEMGDTCKEMKNSSNMEESITHFLEKYQPSEKINRLKTIYNQYSKCGNMNSLKLERFCEVFEMASPKKPKIKCLEETLQIEGEFIKFDQIPPNNHCPNRIKKLELFAYNTIFVNADLIRNDGTVVVAIAPKWVLDGNRNITLDGPSAKEHQHPKALKKNTPGSDGPDGIPGLPGKPAGSFLGIGLEISSIANTSVNFHISTNGGGGGKGQDGADGTKGKDGALVEMEPKDVYFEDEALSKLMNCRYPFPKDHRCYYNNLTQAQPSGKGGNGGKGGHGGKAGRLQIFLPFDPEGNIKIIKNNKSGVAGADGRGGQGGPGALQGPTIVILYKFNDPLFKFNRNFERVGQKTLIRRQSPKGHDGLSGNSTQGIELPKDTEPTEFRLVLNRYKENLRADFIHGLRRSKLMELYNRLNDEGFINGGGNLTDLDDTLGLVDELRGLEEQFFKLRKDLDLLPFYKSLLRRTNNYAKNPKPEEKNLEYKGVLTYLYTTTLSKICSLEDDAQNSLIINIRKYLSSALEDVKQFVDATDNLKRNKVNNDFKSDIEKKISEANGFAEEIGAEVKNVQDQMNAQLELLAEEAAAAEESELGKLKKLEAIKKSTQKNIEIKAIFGILKTVATVTSFLGPWTGAFGMVISTSVNVAEHFVLEANGENDRDFAREDWATALNSAREEMKKVCENLWEDEKEALSEHINRNSSLGRESSDSGRTEIDLEKIKDSVDLLSDDNIVSLAESIIKKKEKKNTTDEHEIKISKDDVLKKSKTKLVKMKENVIDQSRNRSVVSEDVDVMKRKLKKITDKHNEKGTRKVGKKKIGSVLKHTPRVNKVGIMGLEFMDGLQSTDSGLQGLENEIDSTKENVKALNRYQDGIRKEMMPMLRNMRANLENFEKSLSSKSSVALDVNKWQLQKRLTNLKSKLQDMTSKFQSVSNIFGTLVDKLIDTFNTLIDIYQRIQQYQDRVALVGYIKEIVSPQMDSPLLDKKLKGALLFLKVLLTSNTILDPYERSMHALKKYAFPFAEFYLKEFSLPPELRLNDTKTLREKAVNQIQRISKRVEKTFAMIIPGMDEFIHEGEFSVDSQFSGPFFVWGNDKNKAHITDLLSGKEVILQADVEGGLNKNAIKFNAIEIQLRTVNPKMQKQLDDDLRNFAVNMTHTGNSYYRCGAKYYVMTGNKQAFSYTFQKNNNSTNPIEKSLSYAKFQNGDFILSPYTFWRIHLLTNFNSTFDILKKYENQVDIALGGHGRYIDLGIEVCNLDLGKYYEEEIRGLRVEDLRK